MLCQVLLHWMSFCRISLGCLKMFLLTVSAKAYAVFFKMMREKGKGKGKVCKWKRCLLKNRSEEKQRGNKVGIIIENVASQLKNKEWEREKGKVISITGSSKRGKGKHRFKYLYRKRHI